MKLNDYIYSTIKLTGNTSKYIDESSEIITKKMSTKDSQIEKVEPNSIELGNFYIFKYMFNNTLYIIPIFLIDYRVDKGKHILYAVNLSLLPYLYKSEIFSFLFQTNKGIIDKNKEISCVSKEKPLQTITFEKMYNLLREVGDHIYSIDAYDVTKIHEVYKVSTNIAYRFLFFNPNKINRENLKYLKETANREQTDRLGELIEQLEQDIAEYQENSKEYYKRLKSFEQHLKKL